MVHQQLRHTGGQSCRSGPAGLSRVRMFSNSGGAPSGLVGADHPHRKELCGTAVGVAQRTAHTIHLMITGLASRLHRRLTKTDHPRRTDRVRRQHPTRTVHRQLPVRAGRTRLGQLPVFQQQLTCRGMEQGASTRPAGLERGTLQVSKWDRPELSSPLLGRCMSRVVRNRGCLLRSPSAEPTVGLQGNGLRNAVSDPVTRAFGAVPGGHDPATVRFDMAIGVLRGFSPLDELWAVPPRPTPAAISEYPGTQGEPVFLEQMARLTNSERGVTVGWERVVATHGAYDGLAHALAPLPPDSPVIHALPGFDITSPIRRAGHVPVGVRWSVEEPIETLFERIELAVRMAGRLSGVVVNFPANPGGQSPTPRQWLDLLDLVDRTGVLLVVDDVYGFFEERPAEIYEHPRVILVESFSKRLGAPGLRLGAAICPLDLVPAVRASIAHSTVGVARWLCEAGAAALRSYMDGGLREQVSQEVARRRREFRLHLQAKVNESVVLGSDSLYATVRLPPGISPTVASEELVGLGLATTPGTALLGEFADQEGNLGGFLRLCLGGTVEAAEAADLLGEYLVAAQEPARQIHWLASANAGQQ